jgi:hypothetical protein
MGELMLNNKPTFATHCGVAASALLTMFLDGENLEIDKGALLEDMIELASRLNIATEALNQLGAIYLSDQLEDMNVGNYENE